MHLPQSAEPRLAINTIMEDLKCDPPFRGFDELKEVRAACFVSLHIDKNGGAQLRGCIGTLSPVHDSLYDEICSNARSAAFHDPRFLPLKKNELDDLTITVDVLESSEPIESIEQLDQKIYGVIVEKGDRKGVLLPDLEGVDSVAKQVEIARMKAGIGPDDTIQLYRFKVVRYH